MHIKSEPVTGAESETPGVQSEAGIFHAEASTLTGIPVMGNMYSKPPSDCEKQDTAYSSNLKPRLHTDSETPDSPHSLKSKSPDGESLSRFQAASISNVEMSIRIKSEPVSGSERHQDVRFGPVAARHGSEEAATITQSQPHTGLTSNPARDMNTLGALPVPVKGEAMTDAQTLIRLD